MPGSVSAKPQTAPSSAQYRTKTFLSLPLEIRNKIYNHLLTILHPIYIFQDRPNSSNIESFVPEISQRTGFWTVLLYVNRQISVEARAILYGENQFQLMELDTKHLEAHTPSLLKSFLEYIGHVNAASLSYLCIKFPAIEENSGGFQSTRRIRIRKDGLQKLLLLRSACTGLRILEMVFTGGLVGTGAESVREVLQEIDMHFQAFPSLSRIIIRILDRTLYPSATVRNIMQDLGWTVLLGER